MDKEILIILTFSCRGSKQEHTLGSQTMKNLYFYYHPLFKQHVKAQTKSPGLPCAKLFTAIRKGAPKRMWVWQEIRLQDETRKNQEFFWVLLVLHSMQLKQTWPSGEDLHFKAKIHIPPFPTLFDFFIRQGNLYMTPPPRQSTLFKLVSHLNKHFSFHLPKS